MPVRPYSVATSRALLYVLRQRLNVEREEAVWRAQTDRRRYEITRLFRYDVNSSLIEEESSELIN